MPLSHHCASLRGPTAVLRPRVAAAVAAAALCVMLLSAGAMSAPVGTLTATCPTATSVQLSWSVTGVAQVYSYDLRIATLGTNAWYYRGLSTTFTYTKARPNWDYAFQVRANTSVGQVYSNTCTVRPGAVLTPTAPSNLAATALASPRQIDLTWSDNSTDEQGFTLERATASGGPFVQIAKLRAGAKCYSDSSNLAAGTTYYYRVCAFNTVGNSAYSNTASATTQATLPAAPSNLSATAASSSQINLQWTDNSSNETGFRIERSIIAGGPFTQVATTGAGVTTYSNTGLAASTTYYYRVCAYNSAGASVYSNAATATTLGAPPNAPSNLAATAVSTSQIDLQWTDNSSNETGFGIEIASAQAGPFLPLATVGAGVTAYSCTNLGEGVTVYFRVYAYNSSGSSAFAGPAGATTQSGAAFAPQLVGFISDVGTVQDVVVVGTTAYLASDPFGLVIVDVSDPSYPFVLGSQHPLGPANQVAVSADGRLAIATGTPRGTDIVDISDSYRPEVVASIAGTSCDAAFVGGYAYVAGGDVKVVDVSVPSQPSLVYTLVTPGSAQGIAVSGSVAVIGDGSAGMQVVDVGSPASPRIVGTASIVNGYAGYLAIRGSLALLVNNNYEVKIADISVPSAPRWISTVAMGCAINIDCGGNLAAVGANSLGLRLVDISNPSSPTIVATYKPADNKFNPIGCAIRNGKAFVAANGRGLCVLDVSNPAAPVSVGTYTTPGACNDAIVTDSRIITADGTAEIGIFELSP